MWGSGEAWARGGAAGGTRAPCTSHREASGRLARLLACGAGCARAPALALLYASIVARVLAGYQQAAASCCAAWSAGGRVLMPASYGGS